MLSAELLPFARVTPLGDELDYLAAAIRRGALGGGGEDSAWCAEWLRERTGAAAVFMTPSCTASLELAALVADLSPGDEVLMPSWTFVSTANAVVLAGATPVWVDAEPGTLNLDPDALGPAIGSRSRALTVVHYGGVGADMEAIGGIAAEHGLFVVEDAAHGLAASRAGRALGTASSLGCISFDEQKNVSCGEGGALLVNEPELIETVEIACDKGTNRARLVRGEAREYAWTGTGSSWKLGGLPAAFLRGQLEHADAVTARRRDIWRSYHEALEPFEEAGRLSRPRVPEGCFHNAHIYWIMLSDQPHRDSFIEAMREHGIVAPFHYVPLHLSPAGRRLGRAGGALPVTERAGETLVRLPLWAGMTDAHVERVIDATWEILSPSAQKGSRNSQLRMRSGSLARAE